jgi:hypothetical protein
VQTLVGRDAECGRITRLLRAARLSRSGVLVLLGEPGIGKTALCTWALQQADAMGVVTARGVESEHDIPYAALAELCAGPLSHLDRLPTPQARALDGALGHRGSAPQDRFAIGAAVLSLLSAAAEQRSMLVLVDDAQWLDRSSTDALLFAARRLREDGVAMHRGRTTWRCPHRGPDRSADADRGRARRGCGARGA